MAQGEVLARPKQADFPQAAPMLSDIQNLNETTAREAKAILGGFVDQKKVSELLLSKKSPIPDIIKGLSPDNVKGVHVARGRYVDAYSISIETTKGLQILTLAVDERSIELSRATRKDGQELVLEMLVEKRGKKGASGEIDYQRLA
jgi:hypothetical protein